MSADDGQMGLPTIATHFLDSPFGKLELKTALPVPGHQRDGLPILLLHGTNCAAACYREFLSLFAENGYPTYALSLRNHGKSYKMSWFWMMFLTTLDNFAEDVECAIEYIKSKHHGQSPVLAGHSFGGGVLQYMLSARGVQAPALILLASAPLTGGGKEIMANWSAVEAPNGYDWIWSPRFQLDTTAQVKAAFFSPDCPDEIVEEWLKESRTPCESARAGLAALWPFGTAEKVLAALDGLPRTGKKVLCVAGGNDKLVTKDMVAANVEHYRAVDGRNGVVEEEVVDNSAHHLMCDIAHKECADVILKWLD